MIPYKPIPILFHIGNYPVYTEFLAMILAFIIYFWLVIRHLKKEKVMIKGSDIYDFVLILIITSLLGGRLWHFVAEGQSLNDFISLNGQGITSFGMLLGGVVGVLFFIWVKRKDLKKENRFSTVEFAKVLDVLALYAGIWIFIYRILGCTLNGDVIGTPTNIPWAFVWPDGVARHPTSVYLGLAGLLIFGLLWFFFKKEKTEHHKFGKRFDGEVGLWFLVLYIFLRILIEFTRMDTNFGILQTSLIVIFLLSIFTMISCYDLLNDIKKMSNEDQKKHQDKFYKSLKVLRYVKKIFKIK